MVLFKLAGSQATACRRKLVCKIDGKVHLRIQPDLTLPIKAQHTYLGAIISFGRFEDLNAAHRCQAGIATYQRLRKHLHSQRTWPLHKRLRLWQAYVIPSAFYSLTASGLTDKGAALSRVELLRQLRAIANQPRHLTLVSDSQFLCNIGLRSPLQQLIDRQRGMLDRTQALRKRLKPDDARLDPALEAYERSVLQGFLELLGDAPPTSGDAERGHACPDCEKCFPTSASLRQHRAKVHRSGENKAVGERFDRLLHGKEGMPQCVNCGHRFRMWEELQRHVELGRCQAATRVDYDDVQAPILARVIDQQITFPEVLFLPPSDDLRKELIEHCAVCRQWLPNENYMKIHYGRVHKDEWQAHTSRLRVWCTNNLAPIKGACQWCGHKAQQGRDHRATCPAIFQLAMTWFMTGGPPDLPAMMGPTDAPFPSAEEVKPLLGTCQLCQADISKQRYKTHMQRQHGEIWRTMQPRVQLLCAAWTGSITTPCSLCGAKSNKKAEHVHTCVPLQQHALKLSMRHDERRGDHGCVRQLPAGAEELQGGGHRSTGGAGAERGPGHAASGQAFSTGAGAGQGIAQRRQGQRGSARQRHQGPRPVEQRGTQQLGQQRMEAATVPGARTACGGPLPPDLEAGGGAPAHQDGEAIPSAHGIRATGDAQASLGGSPGLESGQGQNPSDGAELSPRGLDQVSLSGVDCQARHDDQGPGDTQEDGGTGMGESARGDRATVELSAVECSEPSLGAGPNKDAHRPYTDGPDCERPPDLGECRERDAGTPFPLDAQTHRNGHGGHDAVYPIGSHAGYASAADARCTSSIGRQCSTEAGGGASPRGAFASSTIGAAHCKNGGSTTTLKAAGILATSFTLHDRHGYVVACTLAWLMAGADHYDMESIAGSLAHAAKSFLTMGPSFRLASSFPWRGALQGWDHTKVDAVQWLQHILPRAAAPTMRGRWEARASLQGACACTHAADTWSPLYLQADIGAGASDLDLTALFSEWRFQDDRCALVQAPQLLCVAFPRWLNSAEGERRLITQSKAPTAVHVPCFSAEGDTTYTIPYYIVSVIMRDALGGRFGARYWASFKKTGWHSHANGKIAKAVKLNDTTIHARYCDAVFLRRVEESAIGGTA